MLAMCIPVNGMHVRACTLALRFRDVLESTRQRSEPALQVVHATACCRAGGSPISTGVYYDVSYDRTLFAPDDHNCTGSPGTVVAYDETIDKNGIYCCGPGALNPNLLPKQLKNGQCSPVYPHQYPRVNNIFSVRVAAFSIFPCEIANPCSIVTLWSWFACTLARHQHTKYVRNSPIQLFEVLCECCR